MYSLLAVCALMAGDWPQFRGPNSDGHATGPDAPLTWSETQNVAWKVDIPGLGWSSPVVVGERLYLTTAVPKGEGLSLRGLCLSTATGETVWDTEVRSVETSPSIHSKNSHASPTPIVRDGALYVHFGPLGTARLSARDGSLEWLSTELPYPPLHGSGGSPVLHEGKLVVVCDGSRSPFVAALDVGSGKVVWKTLRSQPARISHSFVTATIATVDGKAQVMAPGPDHFAAYDLATGTELWRVLAPGWSVVPQPAIAHGLVIYNHDYDNPELIAARLGGVGDVTDSHVVWRIKTGAPSTPSPVLSGDDLFYVADNGVASCINTRSGERYWMKRIGGNFSASPILASGRILLLNETGVATWIRASREFETIATNEVPGRTLATPAIVRGDLYLRTDTKLYKIAH